MQQILVIRFGSLGDLCLLAWSLCALARQGGQQRRVTLVTKAAFAELMARVPGVDEVVPLERGDIFGLLALARRLRKTRFDTVVDAHNIMRGHLLLTLLGRRSELRLEKDTVARLALLHGGRSDRRLDRSMRDRFSSLLAPLRGTAREVVAAEVDSGPPPFANLAAAATSEGARPVLGVAPGAMWPAKQWPDGHFADLLRRFRAVSDSEIRIFLGPREAQWFDGSELAAALDSPRGPGGPVRILRDQPLTTVATALADCRVLLSNDSGLMHLAEAAGTPVLAFFGPTVRAFGYFPGLAASRVLEIELECRPCSRNGKRPCHRGDLACLERITPDTALRTLLAMADWPPAPAAATSSLGTDDNAVGKKDGHA